MEAPNLWLSSPKHDRLARQVPPCRTSPFAAALRESKTTFSYAKVVFVGISCTHRTILSSFCSCSVWEASGVFSGVQRASVRCLIPQRSPLGAVNTHFQTVMLLTVHVFWRQSHVLSLLPLNVAFFVVLCCLKEVSYPLRCRCGHISAVQCQWCADMALQTHAYRHMQHIPSWVWLASYHTSHNVCTQPCEFSVLWPNDHHNRDLPSSKVLESKKVVAANWKKDKEKKKLELYIVGQPSQFCVMWRFWFDLLNLQKGRNLIQSCTE